MSWKVGIGLVGLCVYVVSQPCTKTKRNVKLINYKFGFVNDSIITVETKLGEMEWNETGWITYPKTEHRVRIVSVSPATHLIGRC